jgi:hypothetical protein
MTSGFCDHVLLGAAAHSRGADLVTVDGVCGRA